MSTGRGTTILGSATAIGGYCVGGIGLRMVPGAVLKEQSVDGDVMQDCH